MVEFRSPIMVHDSWIHFWNLHGLGFALTVTGGATLFSDRSLTSIPTATPEFLLSQESPAPP
jgi:hypothetical protein